MERSCDFSAGSCARTGAMENEVDRIGTDWDGLGTDRDSVGTHRGRRFMRQLTRTKHSQLFQKEAFMPRIKGTTDAQSAFLRKLRNDPTGMPAEDWPSAVKMRRWMRRKGFRKALTQVWRVLQVQADLQLMGA